MVKNKRALARKAVYKNMVKTVITNKIAKAINEARRAQRTTLWRMMVVDSMGNPLAKTVSNRISYDVALACRWD